jgi:hypothetical protein
MNLVAGADLRHFQHGEAGLWICRLQGPWSASACAFTKRLPSLCLGHVGRTVFRNGMRLVAASHGTRAHTLACGLSDFH